MIASSGFGHGECRGECPGGTVEGETSGRGEVLMGSGHTLNSNGGSNVQVWIGKTDSNFHSPVAARRPW